MVSILPLYYRDKASKAWSLREEGFKDALSLSTVIRCPVGKTKLSMECLSVKRGHFHPSETHRSALGLRQRREGWGSQIPKMLCRAQAQARQLFDAQNVHSHGRSLTLVCARVTQHSPEKKHNKARLASSTSSALFPRRSLYPAA